MNGNLEGFFLRMFMVSRSHGHSRMRDTGAKDSYWADISGGIYTNFHFIGTFTNEILNLAIAISYQAHVSKTHRNWYSLIAVTVYLTSLLVFLSFSQMSDIINHNLSQIHYEKANKFFIIDKIMRIKAVDTFPKQEPITQKMEPFPNQFRRQRPYYVYIHI